MNIFIITRNYPSEKYSTIISELRKMNDIYPQLDPDTIWHYGKNNSVFAASMHTAAKAAQPRRYVWLDTEQVVLFDGCPIDRTGEFKAHNAKQLFSNWNQISSNLEGQFVVVSMSSKPPFMELITDPLGMEQVYYYHHNNVWIISNSVWLIRRICKESTNDLDPVAVSSFLCMGYVGGDRTLYPDIKVIPGGQHWKWKNGNSEPFRESYFSPSYLAKLKQKKLSKQVVTRLADDMGEPLRVLDENFEKLTCPLTGGRDSRLLAALFNKNGISAKYYTGGSPLGPDVKIGSKIAKMYNLSHELIEEKTERLIEDWEKYCLQLIQQHDGMVSLWQIIDILNQPPKIDNLNVNVWGVGGEIARGYYTNPKNFLLKYDTDDIKRYLTKRLIKDYGKLIRREAIKYAEEHVRRFVDRTVKIGFRPLDVPDVFYTYDRVRRWGGSNGRKNMNISDRFSPFCTRAFIEAVFTIPTLSRYSEPLHFQMTKSIAPELHSVPFDKGPWRSQYPLMHILIWILKKPTHTLRNKIQHRFFPRVSSINRTTWMEAKSPLIRELCLDQANSELWTFVNRTLFERITRRKTDSARYHPPFGAIYDIATLFYYFSN